MYQWSGSSGLVVPHCGGSEGLRRPIVWQNGTPAQGAVGTLGRLQSLCLQKRMSTSGSILAWSETQPVQLTSVGFIHTPPVNQDVGYYVYLFNKKPHISKAKKSHLPVVITDLKYIFSTWHWLWSNENIKFRNRDFPGSPVVKTLNYQWREHRFNPWVGT